MNKIPSYLFNALLSLTCIALIACTGTQIGLNEVKPVNPTEPFSTLEPSMYSSDEVGDAAKELIRSYHEYGALFSIVERESPTVENTCYELTEKVEKVKPLLREQENILKRIETSYKTLAALRKDDARIKNAVEAGRAYIAKAGERIKKYDDLMDITKGFSDDCPRGSDWVVHLAFGVTGLAQYLGAREKAPLFNETAREFEELSAQEKTLAAGVVQSLKALR